MDQRQRARYWQCHSEYSEDTRASERASFYWLLNSQPSPFCAHVHMCLCLLQLEWKLQTQTLVIQLWDNKAQSPEGYLDTENTQNNLSKARRDRKWKKNRRQRWEKAKRKLTMTVFMYFIYWVYSPSREGCLCDLREQNAAWWNSATTTWQMRA